MTAVQPFTIHVPDEVLADLRERLARTRWPGEIGCGVGLWRESGLSQGLVDYWRTQFDWRAQEAALNRFAHFRTTLDGMGFTSSTSAAGAQPAAPHHHPRLAQHRL